MSSNGINDRPPPVGSSIMNDDDDGDDDIEALASKACALASVPVPDYADAMKRSNARSKKMYGDRFTIGDDEAVEEDDDKSGMMLAEKTSQILSSFEDYVSGIGGEAGAATKDILESGGAAGAGAGAGAGGGEEADNKKKHDRVQGNDVESNNRGAGSAKLNRGWDYEGYSSYSQTKEDPNRVHNSRNLHDRDGTGSIGSWEDEVSAVGMMLARGQKYTHPVLQSSKKSRYGCAVVVIAIISGVCIGVSANKKSKDKLSEQIKELEDELEHNNKIEPENTKMGPPSSTLGGGGEGGSFVDEFDTFFAGGGGKVKEDQNKMTFMMAKYQPKEYDRDMGWEGKTYLEAYDFCSQIPGENGIKYDICPYEGVCPFGPDTEPVGGYREDDPADTWIPIADNANDWTQLGRENSCVKYSHEAEDLPEWGVTGSEDGTMTSRVMCCKLVDTLKASFAGDTDKPSHGYTMGQNYMFQNILSKYQPGEFDRQKGWYGRTYLEADEFCGQQKGPNEEKYEICPYAAICPLGPDSKPLGGYKEDDPGMTWIPIADKDNDWTQLSEENACIKYSSENAYPPEWGLTGEEDSKMTSHVMCCMALEHVDEDAAISASVTAIPGGVSDDNIPAYQAVEKQYMPLEFDRSKGWKGQTYIEALQFCGAMNGYEICQYSAICPLGYNSTPLGGTVDSVKGAWVPILDGANEWVQTGPENTCVKYSSEYPEPPDWSTSGVGNEDITRHIICCLLDNSKEEDVSVSTGGITPVTSDAPFPEEELSNAIQEAVDMATSAVDTKQLAYEFTSQMYHPMEYDRKTGWDGRTYAQANYFCAQHDGYGLCSFQTMCPLGADSKPLGGYKNMADGKNQQTWMPISDMINDWVQVSEESPCIKFSGENPELPSWGVTGYGAEQFTENLMCCLLIPDNSAITDVDRLHSDYEEDQIYKNVATTYQPVDYDREKGWMGQTYADAMAFCGSRNGKSLCPFEVICPLGVDTLPLAGYREGAEESWIPILDEAGGGNEWVQVARANACVRWSNEHPTSPEWGITGEGNEQITQHVMCCVYIDAEEINFDTGGNSIPVVSTEAKTDESVTEEAIGSYADDVAKVFAEETAKFLPVHYSRDDGWEGKTYLEAIQFCARVDGYDICPFRAICPIMGGDSEPEPLWGNSQPSSWVPISGKSNEWVNVGTENPCIQWSNAFPTTPGWGLTGEGSEEITQDILCCKGDMMGTAEEGFMYEMAAKKYHPIWYDRQYWMGGSYQDAAEFCGSRSNSNVKTGLCPFEAICPLADLDAPMGGIREEPNGSWVPFSDADNSWVSVSSENTCGIYGIVNGKPPDWGVTGVGNEDLTRHLVCCEIGYAEGTPVPTPLPTSLPTSLPTPLPTRLPTMPPTPLPTLRPTPLPTPLPTFLSIHFSRDDGWNGKTYREAVQFCADLDGYDICPYRAICKMGADSEPLRGNSQPSSWAPISDHANDWVNIGTENTCIQWSNVNPTTPDWGLSGEGSEEITQDILCCKGDMMGTAEEGFMYEMAVKKYHPTWYGSQNGWMGGSYQDAAQFCGSGNNSNVITGLCPFEAICPLADLDAPLGGIREEPNGSWVPFSDADNSWVSVSSENTCKIYGIVNGKPPDWGVTGVGNEDLTRHLVCCEIGYAEGTPVPTPLPTSLPTSLPTLLPTRLPTMPPTSLPTLRPTPLPTPLPTLLPTPIPTKLPTPVPTPLPSNRPTPPPIPGAVGTSVEASKNTEKYKPQWYDRNSGWTGQTYDEAFEFCSSKGPQHDICPYSVLCPDGPLKLPYGGSQAEKTSWAPIYHPFNSWVLVTEPQVCVKYQNLNPKNHPAWGLTGVDNEDLTRHIMCCEMPDDDTPDTSEQAEVGAIDAYSHVLEKYEPRVFDRANGWKGKSYADSITFCAAQDSYIPCPYAAYCPLGPANLPSAGYDGSEEAWAPIMDSPNGWVQIGSYKKDFAANSCMKYNDLNDNPPLWGLLGNADEDLTPHIMCCKEEPDHATNGLGPMSGSTVVAKATTTLEQEVLDEMHPVWFGRVDGYHGKTHSDAVDFCKAVGDMALCPPKAYCPSSGSDRPLFLDRDPFDGEQWAPASESGVEEEYWISIGEVNTCITHEEMLLPLPSWAADGSRTELKEHVLCCQNPKYLAKEQSMHDDLSPIWMDTSHGWSGGSHDEAGKFCETFGNRKPCPYTAYCPHGPGHPVMGGHATDFNTEGEHWAPVYGEQNHWVMIGQKYQNRATTCMGNMELEGRVPDWGTSQYNAEMKKHVMCCAFK